MKNYDSWTSTTSGDEKLQRYSIKSQAPLAVAHSSIVIRHFRSVGHKVEAVFRSRRSLSRQIDQFCVAIGRKTLLKSLGLFEDWGQGEKGEKGEKNDIEVSLKLVIITYLIATKGNLDRHIVKLKKDEEKLELE